jgi:hypothetical protein
MRGAVRANNEMSRAAFWSVTAEPTVPFSTHKADYCVRCRLLLILPGNAPALFVHVLPGWQTNRVREPDEEMCQKLVARVCAYPVGLLTGPVEDVHKILVAKRGLRLTEISGEFRGQRAEVEILH